MVTVHEAYERETGIVTRAGSVQFQRHYYRDMACALWLLRDGLRSNGLEGAKEELKLLKFITTDESPHRAMDLLGKAVVRVVEQTRHMKAEEGSFLHGVQRAGLESITRHLLFTIRVFMQSLDGIARLLMLPTWADHGFPCIQVGHKLASSLLVTRISEDVLDGMRLPFPVFEIDLPSGMFQTEVQSDSGPEIMGFNRLLCGTFEGVFDNGPMNAYAIIASAEKCGLWNVKHSIKDLGDIIDFAPTRIEDSMPDEQLKDLRVDVDVTESDPRTITMLARLFANTALMMSASGNYKPIGKGHGLPTAASTSRGNKRNMPVPSTRVFQLTAPVRHDFREVVTDYMRGGGKPPSVQGVVTGHWKMQAHGAGRQLRRPMFIEPYWRGPEDAPIALRSHKLK